MQLVVCKLLQNLLMLCLGDVAMQRLQYTKPVSMTEENCCYKDLRLVMSELLQRLVTLCPEDVTMQHLQ